MRVPVATQPVLDALRDRVTGRVVSPDDPDDDAMRTIMIGGIDPRPAAIVRVGGPADVVATLAVSRDAGLPIAVRSGGHSGAGHGSVDGGIGYVVRKHGLTVDNVLYDSTIVVRRNHNVPPATHPVGAEA